MKKREMWNWENVVKYADSIIGLQNLRWTSPTFVTRIYKEKLNRANQSRLWRRLFWTGNVFISSIPDLEHNTKCHTGSANP